MIQQLILGYWFLRPLYSICWAISLSAFSVEVTARSQENFKFVSPEPTCLGLERIYRGHVPLQGRPRSNSREGQR
ncbi:hypothetical protein JB92DRAFT_2879121 [Gautieria morchelliformis]|nr:hypothetical protein JB92DRAFT_2879121 [Gautieria morchelliformis]